MTEYRIDSSKKPVIPNKIGAFLVVIAFISVLLTFFFVSAFDTDKTVSQKENRTLKAKPEFTITALLDGTYFSEFEEYFQDTFPLRDSFLNVNTKISTFFSKFGAGDDSLVIVEKQEKDDFAGQNID